MSKVMNERCKKCGETLERLMLLAMIEDAGARVYPSASACEHDFEKERSAIG